MLFEFVKEMPKSKSIAGKFDLASIVAVPFFTLVVLQLFPVSAEISEQIYQLRIKLCVPREVNRNEWTVVTLYYKMDFY